MRRALALSGAMSLLLTITPALSESTAFMTGNDLFGACAAKPDVFLGGVCSGYIVGIADAMSNNSLNEYRSCIPSAANRKQLHDVAVKYMTDHPEARQYSASSIVASALAEAFPC